MEFRPDSHWAPTIERFSGCVEAYYRNSNFGSPYVEKLLEKDIE
jgi:hypothetical protein